MSTRVTRSKSRGKVQEPVQEPVQKKPKKTAAPQKKIKKAAAKAEDEQVFGKHVSVVTMESPTQRTFHGVALPLALQAEGGITDMDGTVSWLKEHQAELEEKLKKHGAVFFRGFPVKTGQDFDAFVSAFQGWESLPYDKSLSFAVRVVITDKVSTTNEGRAGGQIFHHEQAQTPLYPSKLFFMCVTPADKGGGTAITPSDVILESLTAKHPEFVQKLEKLGVKYTSIMNADQDTKIGAGRGWKSFFNRDNKEAVEDRMKELGYTWEWLEGDRLRATTPVLSAIRMAPGTEKRVFFNQLIAQVANAREFAKSMKASEKTQGETESAWLDQFMVFGDGSSLDPTILEYVRELSEKHAVELHWQAGDVCLIDNMQVMHARRAFDDPRRNVLAAIFT